jgi:hypothetical protein
MKDKKEKENENQNQNQNKKENQKENENKIVGALLNIKIHLKNIDGIFDYSSSKNNCFNVFVKKKDKIKSFIARTENNNIKSFQNQSDFNSAKPLFQITYVKNFKMENPLFKENMAENELNINSINNYIWYVVNSVDNIDSNKKKESIDSNKKDDIIDSKENEDYYLSENDILKFGKVKYIVKEIHIENNKNININNNKKIFDLNHICKAHKYCEFCKGLMIKFYEYDEFEHFNCIKDWINDRIITRENEIVNSYYFNIFQCKEYIRRNCNEEKCEKDDCCKKCNIYYPLYFKLDQNGNPSEEEKKGQKEYFEFYEIKKPEKCDYLILESLPHIDKTSNSPKIEKDIHIIKLTGKDINIGSGQNNDVVIHDKSVCKMHSVIKHDKYNGKLLIKNKSKRAGTLVLIKNKIVDLSEKEKYFRVDKTFFSARLIKKEEIKNLIKDLKEDEDVKILEL